jgi:hypothetical protein
MKSIPIFIILSVASLLVMIVIDYVLGARAEFINAWSVIERLLGRPPSAGESAVFRYLGALGELIIVGLINVLIGGVLTLVVRLFVGK